MGVGIWADPISPLQTVVVGAYLIAQGFFSVYSMCVDTLFLCFRECPPPRPPACPPAGAWG